MNPRVEAGQNWVDAAVTFLDLVECFESHIRLKILSSLLRLEFSRQRVEIIGKKIESRRVSKRISEGRVVTSQGNEF